MSKFGPEKMFHHTAAGGPPETPIVEPLYPSFEYEAAAGMMFNKEEYELTVPERALVEKFVQDYREVYPAPVRQRHSIGEIKDLIPTWWAEQGRSLNELHW